MSTYTLYKVKDKKCATCLFWTGTRSIELLAYKPRYVKAEAGKAKCLAQKGRTPTAATYCPGWKLWEKLFGIS